MAFTCCKCSSPDLAGCTRYIFLIAREVVAKSGSGDRITLSRLEPAGPLDFGNHEMTRFSILLFQDIKYESASFRPGDWKRFRPIRRTAAFLCARCGPDQDAAKRFVQAQLKEREAALPQTYLLASELPPESPAYNIQSAFPDDETMAWKTDVRLIFNVREHKGMPLTNCPLVFQVDDLIQGVGELHRPSSTEVLTFEGAHQVSLRVGMNLAGHAPSTPVFCVAGATYVITAGKYDTLWGRMKPATVQQVATVP